MGLTDLDTQEELGLLGPRFRKEKVAEGFRNKVFLYEVNQLSNDDGGLFKEGVLRFAGVDPHADMPSIYKVVPGAADSKYRTNGPKEGTEESIERNRIDICDAENDRAREGLMLIARDASEWITGYLMEAGRGQLETVKGFRERVEEWKVDPCIKRKATATVLFSESNPKSL
ncbi:hypothetical protein TrRE_jg9549 [Triparma retinervis]|uniref:Uncharacterized protein n=1 Tax=Triparma retinervis TaxID=2557542 RepID=A0A9W7A5K3_9STRA|nr:hypothetical protein TrRE_jg9549 [Triparma retinervis]